MSELSPRKNPDYFVLLLSAFIIIFGLVMLSSASANLGGAKFDDNYFFIKHQITHGFLPGLVGFVLAFYIYYGAYEKISIFLLFGSMLSLLLLFTPLGLESGGAGRWLNIGGFTFQPSEFLKLTFIMYLAAWFAGSGDRQKNFWRGLFPFLIILGLLGLILLKQSSTSTFALLLATACIMYFANGAKYSFLLSIAGASIIGLALVSYLTPYRWQRIMTYFEPNKNYETSGYHINQALIAIGNGGLGGVGLGESTTKIKYLPEPIGDSIFAVISEEIGFIGSVSVIILLWLLTGRILFLSMHTSHKFGQLLLIGFACLIGLQSFTNIAAISGLIPLTGMPLPFISYGGTGLTVYMIILGVIVNISKYTR